MIIDVGKTVTEKKLEATIVGLKDIDHEIIPFLVEINSYKGVTTVTSCAGHTIEDIEKEQNEKPSGHPGRALYPYLDMMFDNADRFATFCHMVASLGEETQISLIIHPQIQSVWIEPVATGIQVAYSKTNHIYRVPSDKLSEARNNMFRQVIAILRRLVAKEFNKEALRFKIMTIKTLPEKKNGGGRWTRTLA